MNSGKERSKKTGRISHPETKPEEERRGEERRGEERREEDSQRLKSKRRQMQVDSRKGAHAGKKDMGRNKMIEREMKREREREREICCLNPSCLFVPESVWGRVKQRGTAEMGQPRKTRWKKRAGGSSRDKWRRGE